MLSRRSGGGVGAICVPPETSHGRLKRTVPSSSHTPFVTNPEHDVANQHHTMLWNPRHRHFGDSSNVWYFLFNNPACWNTNEYKSEAGGSGFGLSKDVRVGQRLHQNQKTCEPRHVGNSQERGMLALHRTVDIRKPWKTYINIYIYI